MLKLSKIIKLITIFRTVRFKLDEGWKKINSVRQPDKGYKNVLTSPLQTWWRLQMFRRVRTKPVLKVANVYKIALQTCIEGCKCLEESASNLMKASND